MGLISILLVYQGGGGVGAAVINAARTPRA